MYAQVQRTIAQYDLLSPHDTILVGLSGGADSVALLHILYELSKYYHYNIQAVHVHHGLRAEEADNDAQFAQSFSESLGIDCKIEYVHVRAYAKMHHMSEEEAGRVLRYEIFQKYAGNTKKIAVAHHAGDQAETLLMRLCRGTGLTGLSGIPPKRNNIIRPLLFCTRAQIETYCKQHHIHYCQDSTNFDTMYTRNKIRQQILPLLEEVHTESTIHIAQTATLLSIDEEYLQSQSKQAFDAIRQNQSLCCEGLQSLHIAIRNRVIRLMLTQIKGDLYNVTQQHIKDIESLLEKPHGKKIQLPQSVWVARQYDKLVFFCETEKQKPYHIPIVLNETMIDDTSGLTITTHCTTKKNDEFFPNACSKVFDYDKITEYFCIRTRQTGDTITLSGGTKRVKKLWIDEKVPQSLRDTIPLLCCGQDVIWIYGRQVSTKYLPDAHTTTYVYITITRGNPYEGTN